MVIIPDIFSPYLAGKEQARAANWDDMNQYNQVQAGQLRNAYDLATFSPKVDNQYTQAEMAKLNLMFGYDTYDNNLFDSWANTMGNAFRLGNNSMQYGLNQRQLEAMSPYFESFVTSNMQKMIDENNYYRNAMRGQGQGNPAGGSLSVNGGAAADPRSLVDGSYGVEQSRRRAANSTQAGTTTPTPSTPTEVKTPRSTTLNSGFGGGYNKVATPSTQISGEDVAAVLGGANEVWRGLTSAFRSSPSNNEQAPIDINSMVQVGDGMFITPDQYERAMNLNTGTGNMDLYGRPRVAMDDGSTATLLSKSFNINGKEVLIPTISPDGRLLTDEEALLEFYTTGKHLGIYNTVEEANRRAQELSAMQAEIISRGY